MSGPRPVTKQRLANVGEALSALCTVGLLVLLPIAARPGEWPITIAIAVALAAGAAPTLAALLAVVLREPEDPATGDPGPIEMVDTRPPGTITTIMRIGDEPAEVLRTSILLAAQSGPCVLVVTGDQELPEQIRSLGVRICRGATMAEAVQSAVRDIRTDAVLLLSGRAVPIVDGCRVAVGRLSDECGWVIGNTRAFNQDRYAPDGRAQVGASLRATAHRAGLDLWEPNATVVRTDLLRAHPLEDGRPWGAWLRDRHAEGHRGARIDTTFAMTAAPAGASTFWPDVMAHQRGNAADAAHAVTSTHGVGRRTLALLLTVRELYALPMLAWVALLFVVASSDRVPFETAGLRAAAVVLGVIVLRWISLRGALAIRLRPGPDVRAALYYLPGSLAAVPSAIRRQVRPPWRRISTRPLVWAALVLTLFTGASLVDHDAGAPVSRLAVGTSLVTLVALWLFSIRALVQRNWERTSFRIPDSLDATVDGVPARTVDCSPDGVAIVGAFDALEASVGDEVRVEITLDDGQRVTSGAVLVDRRPDGPHELVGLSLQLGDEARALWAAQLLRAALAGASTPRSTPTSTPTTTSPAQPPPAAAAAAATAPTANASSSHAHALRVIDRVVVALVLVSSIVVVAGLGLVMLGYHPVVVRSASMTPAIGVGDVVFSEAVPVADLSPGDVITRPASVGGESLTHRLQTISIDGGNVRIHTKGDANESGETWSVPEGSTVQRVRFTVPWIGTLVSGAHTYAAELIVGALVLVLLVWGLLRPRLWHHRNRAAEHDESSPMRAL